MAPSRMTSPRRTRGTDPVEPATPIAFGSVDIGGAGLAEAGPAAPPDPPAREARDTRVARQSEILAEFEELLRSYQNGTSGDDFETMLTQILSRLTTLCHTGSGAMFFAMSEVPFRLVTFAIAVAQGQVDLNNPAEVESFARSIKAIEAKMPVVTLMADRGRNTPDGLQEFANAVRDSATMFSRLLDSVKRDRKEVQDALRQETDAIKRAESAVKSLKWDNIHDTIARLETIRRLYLASITDARQVEFFTNSINILLPLDCDTDLASFKRHLSSKSTTLPETFDAFCTLMRSFESPEKRIASARRVYELATERHDFAGDNAALTLRDRISEIDEQLSKTHDTMNDASVRENFHRHLSAEVYQAVTDIHRLLRLVFKAWGLEKCSTEFRSELSQLGLEYASKTCMARTMDVAYAAGTLRRMFEDSGIRRKIDGVAATVRSERSVRQAAIGNTAAPVLAISDDVAPASNSVVCYVDDALDLESMDAELLAVALAEISCDCCGVKGHRVAQCERTKDTIEAIMALLKKQVMTVSAPTSCLFQITGGLHVFVAPRTEAAPLSSLDIKDTVEVLQDAHHHCECGPSNNLNNFTSEQPREEQDENEELMHYGTKNTALAILTALSTHGERVKGLLDTGASLSVIYDAAVARLRLTTRPGKAVRLQMADEKTRTTREWATISLTIEGVGEVTTDAVVIPGSSVSFDLIIGKKTQHEWFTNITFRADGGVDAVIDGRAIGLPCARRAECAVPTNAIVDLDAEGDSSVGEFLDDSVARAREALKHAQIPDEHRAAIGIMVDKRPGLVRRRVQPAVALDARIRERTPKAEIKMKPDATPPGHQVMRMSQQMRDLLKATIDDLVAEKLLTPSTSPYATRAMLLPKPNGSGEYRFVADYRDLNAGVIRDAYALPSIWTCLQLFEGKSIFSKLDLKSFFFQIPLREDSRPFTAIITDFGNFEWSVMPQGLCTSPAIAQRFINFVLSRDGSLDGKCLRSSVSAYIDDLGLASSTIDEHLRLIDDVLERLYLHGVQVRLDKSVFVTNKMTFLGFLIDGESDPGHTRIRPHPDRLRAMLEFPTPTSPDALRRFLGMTVFLHDLVARHAHIAECLHQIVNDVWDANTWTPKHQEAFDTMKQALASEPFITLPNADDPFVLRVDASNTCMGGALLQRAPDNTERVVVYISKKFSATELNWTAAEKELYALVYSIKRHGYLVQGSEHALTFVSDHKPLEHYRTWTLSPKLSRWMDVLNSVRWTFEYTKGPDNVLGDCMSRPSGETKDVNTTMDAQVSEYTRALCASVDESFDTEVRDPEYDTATSDEESRAHYIMACALVEADADRNTLEATERMWTNDPDAWAYAVIDDESNRDEEVPRDNSPELCGTLNDFRACTREFLEHLRASLDDDDEEISSRLARGEKIPQFTRDSNGFVYRESTSSNALAPRVLYVPQKATHIWGVLLQQYHEGVALHANADKTYHKLARRFFWPHMRRDVERWTQGCRTCQQANPVTRRHYMPMAFPAPTRCFEIVAIDHKTDLPTDERGFDSVLVVVDFLSRLTILIPTRKSHTEEQLHEALYDRVWSKWGFPNKLVSDRGATFTGKVSKLVAKVAGYTPTLSSAGNPKTAAIAERQIRTVLDYLRKYVHDLAHEGANEGRARRWSSMLPAIEYAYNDSVNPRTYPYTPFQIARGREDFRNVQSDVERYFPSTNPLPVEGMSELDAPERVHEYLNTQKDIAEHARDNYRRLTREFLDRNAKRFEHYSPFRVGDLVWFVPSLHLKGEIKEPALDRRRIGPFQIVECLAHNDYRLQATSQTSSEDAKLLSAKRSQVINGERLARYFEPYVDILPSTDFENDALLDFPNFNDPHRELSRSVLSTVTLGERKPFVIVDLGAGEQSLGKAALEIFCDRRQQAFQYVYVSVDSNARTNPTLAWDLFDFFTNIKRNDKEAQYLRPGIPDVVWFSGRCDPFSPANTTGTRDVQGGLALVKAGLDIVAYLNPRVRIMESANSGAHRLSNQPIMATWERDYGMQPHPCSQCHYGFLHRKNTCIWTNMPLSLRCCTRDDPCETMRFYSRHLVTAQNGPAGKDGEIPGMSTALSGRVAPGLTQLLLFRAVMYCLQC